MAAILAGWQSVPSSDPRAKARAMVDPQGHVRTQAYYRNAVAKAAGWHSQSEYRKAQQSQGFKVALREYKAHVDKNAKTSPSSAPAQAILARQRGGSTKSFWEEIRRERRLQGLPPDIES